MDYPGIGPIHAHLFDTKRAQFFDISDDEAMKAALLLSRTEGIIPAIESAHAFCNFSQKQRFHSDEVVVINLSGRGDKDLDTYMKYQY